MGIVIRPGQFQAGHGVEPHPAGKLATTLLSVTVAGMADPPRFRRGKGYVADRAVTRLEVSTGTLRAAVLGSRPDPYDVIVTTTLIDRPAVGDAASLRTVLSQLVPDARDLMVSCSCPDWDDPCKHAVAAILAFAEELTARPELLIEWRCHPAHDGEERPRVGSRAATGRHLRLAAEPEAPSPAARRLAPQRPAAPTPPVSPYATPAWQAYLGEDSPLPAPPDVPTEHAHTGHGMVGTIDLGAVIASAIDLLSALE